MPFVAIVTGANRGIGTAIASALATHPPSTPAYIYACARKPPSQSSSPISFPDPTKTGTTLHWAALDISEPGSIAALADEIQKNHPDGIDVVVNNAGTNVDYEDGMSLPDKAQATMATNVDGTLGMCETFAPLLRRPGLAELGGKSRIVNVSSTGSHVDKAKYGEKVIKALLEAKSISDIHALRDDFLKAAQSGKPGEHGWLEQCYSASKAIMNAMTRVVANDSELGKGILVNCCCPGWVDTGMGNILGKPPKTTEEGSRIPVRLATGDVQGNTGVFWENKDGVFGKGEGQVMEWVQ